MTKLRKGLVGYWTMNERDTSDGTLYDSTPYGNHGTIDTSPIPSVNAPVGGGYAFNGDKVSAFGAPELGADSFTFSFWLRGNFPDSSRSYPDVYRHFWGRNGADDSGFRFDSNSTNRYISEFIFQPQYSSWTHIACVVDQSTGDAYFYEDGIKIRSASFTAGEKISGAAVGFFGNDDLVMDVSEFRYYKRALSGQEINQLYQMRANRSIAPDSPHQDNLLLHLNARNERSVDQTNNRWYDISGNEHEAHGTSGGGAVDDSRFPSWEANNGGRFILTGGEGLNVPGPISTSGALTIESWIYRADLTGDDEYISDARNGGGTWHLTNFSGRNVNFSNSLEADDPEAYQANSNWWGRWLHLVATTDGSNSRLYIDGSEITDARLKASAGFDTTVGQDLAIVNRYTGTNPMEGYISVYRLYDTELTPRQVEVNYESERKYYQ